MLSLARKSVRNEFGRRVLVALGVVVLGLVTAGPSQGGDRPQPEAACAVWDAHLLTLLEDHGEAGDSEDVMAESVATILQARIACREGRLSEALALYDSVQLSWLR